MKRNLDVFEVGKLEVDTLMSRQMVDISQTNIFFIILKFHTDVLRVLINNNQQRSTASHYGLAPNRLQTIIWINDGLLITDAYVRQWSRCPWIEVVPCALDAFATGLLPDPWNCGLCIRRECWEPFPRHHGLTIPACITAHAWPLSDKKPMGFLSDSGHVRAMMHAWGS